MGHFFPGVQQDLLTDQFRQQHPFGLVADHLRWIELWPHGQPLTDHLHQLLAAFSLQGTAAVKGPVTIPEQLLIGLLRPLALFLPELVPFVQHHQHRQALLTQQFNNEGIAAAGALAGLKQQKHQIHLSNRSPGALHQTFTKQVMGLMNPRGIDENHLGLRGCENCPQTIARCLRHWRGDRHFFTNQLIHQGRLAHIRPADQSDETRAIVGRERFHGRQLRIAVHPSKLLPFSALANAALGSSLRARSLRSTARKSWL